MDTTTTNVYPVTEGDGVIYHCPWCRAVNREAGCINHEKSCPAVAHWDWAEIVRRYDEYRDIRDMIWPRI